MGNKKKKGNRGFSAIQFFFVVIIAGIVVIVITKIVFDADLRRRWGVMAYDATLFGYNAVNIQDEERDHMYLQEFVDQELFSEIKNPFIESDEYCHPYHSFVTYEGDKKYVTLECGNYLVDRLSIVQEHVMIYELSEWTTTSLKETKNNQVEAKTLYYIPENNDIYLREPQTSEVFLLIFNKMYQTSYRRIDEIPEDYKVEKQVFYRTKTLVYETKNK